jgi:hypothetical protein
VTFIQSASFQLFCQLFLIALLRRPGRGRRSCLIGCGNAALQATAKKPRSFESSNHGRGTVRRGRLIIASFYNNRIDGGAA